MDADEIARTSRTPVRPVHGKAVLGAPYVHDGRGPGEKFSVTHVSGPAARSPASRVDRSEPPSGRVHRDVRTRTEPDSGLRTKEVNEVDCPWRGPGHLPVPELLVPKSENFR